MSVIVVPRPVALLLIPGFIHFNLGSGEPLGDNDCKGSLSAHLIQGRAL